MAEFQIITGHRGSGKSYLITEITYRAAKEGAIVHSNVAYVWEKWEALGLRDRLVTLSDNPANWEHELQFAQEGSENVLIVDEAALMFHVHDAAGQRAQNKQLFTLLVMGRKLGLDCYFVSQSADNVDIALRRFCDCIVRCKDMRKIPLIGWYFKWRGKIFAREQWTGNGKNFLARKYAKFDPTIGSLYKTDDTMGMFANVKRSVQRVKSEDQSQKDGKRKLLYLVAFLLTCFSWVGYRFWSFTHPAKSQDSSAPFPIVGSPSAKSPAVSGSVVKPREIAASSSGGGVLVLWSDDGSCLKVGGIYEGSRILSITQREGSWDVRTSSGSHVLHQSTGTNYHSQWTKLHLSHRSFSGPSLVGPSSPQVTPQ